MWGADAEDFGAAVKLALGDDDYAILRRYEGAAGHKELRDLVEPAKKRSSTATPRGAPTASKSTLRTARIVTGGTDATTATFADLGVIDDRPDMVDALHTRAERHGAGGDRRAARKSPNGVLDYA